MLAFVISIYVHLQSFPCAEKKYKIYFEITNDKSNNVVYAAILPSSFLTLVGFNQGEGDSD